MNRTDKIIVLGDNGLLGSAVIKLLHLKGYTNVVGFHYPDIDLTDICQTKLVFQNEKPDYVFFFAAVAAGINYKKKHPAEMLLQNVKMIINVMEQAVLFNCKKILNVSSALIYPSLANLPYDENCIESVDLNTVDTPYSLSKAIGIMLSNYYSLEYDTKFVTAIPCNFFGENAPFDDDKASVVSSLIKKMVNAKNSKDENVEVWGTGNAKRELLNSKDVASACVFLMEKEDAFGLFNVGRGEEYSIKEVAETIKKVVGYKGRLVFDSSKPEGKQHMLMNVQKLFKLGWQPSMSLEESIRDAYDWYIKTIAK